MELPAHYDPAAAARWGYEPDQRSLFEAATEARVAPASADGFSVELVAIDLQRDFCFPQGSLFVAGRGGAGAVEDSDRIARLIYANLARITAITATMDTHYPLQIFFAAFWRDRAGAAPAPHTIIALEDVQAGRYRPAPGLAAALDLPDDDWLARQCEHYCAELERAGKYQLYIWPEHCLLGSAGHALAGVFHEARLFHAYARDAENRVEIKGGHALSENYSVFNPEVLTRWDGQGRLAEKRGDFIDRLLARDAVVLVGQAASHCVKSSIDDLLDEIEARDPDFAGKCYVVTDCMSAVTVPDGAGGFLADFTDDAEQAYRRYAEAGMHLVTSTVDMRDWPGMRL
jgi:nicotinamidase-related amidase